jgi:hypothetical protein
MTSTGESDPALAYDASVELPADGLDASPQYNAMTEVSDQQ